jgi:hypothetical protein
MPPNASPAATGIASAPSTKREFAVFAGVRVEKIFLEAELGIFLVCYFSHIQYLNEHVFDDVDNRNNDD